MIGVVLSAGRLGLAAYSGVEAFAEAAIKFGLKLAIKSHGVDRDAGEEMAALMRERVPVDSGRLLNGITVREDGDAVVVEASAVRGDFDYARSIEFGHDVGHGDPLGPPRHRRSRAEHGGHAEAEPFFLSSADEVLESRGVAMDDVIAGAAQESDL